MLTAQQTQLLMDSGSLINNMFDPCCQFRTVKLGRF